MWCNVFRRDYKNLTTKENCNLGREFKNDYPEIADLLTKHGVNCMPEYSFKTDNHSMTVVFASLLNKKDLNSWERSFIDSTNNKFTAGMDLTEKQLSKLSDIWEKY